MVEGEMINFPVDMIGIVKSMFLRSLGNPNALKYTINSVFSAYKDVMLMILSIVILIFLVKFTYKLIKKMLENKKNKKKLLKKQDMKEIFSKEKGIFRILKYPLIGSVLVGTCWMQVSLLFWLFNSSYETLTLNITKEERLPEEGRVLSLRATYALSIFIIAGCFIGLSFGNKMLRNIGILFYVLGIFFIIFGLFLDYGYISDGLENLVI